MSVRALSLVVLLPALMAGCSSMPAVRRALTAPYKPTNIYLRQAALPPEIRRVAILPLNRSRTDENQVAGAELLGQVWIDELTKRNVFEVLTVSPQEIRTLTGGREWTADDKLPVDFLKHVREATGCDAVLFTSLTTFTAYPPLRTGWKARLVDCRQQETWWAVDEIFDAGSESVIVAAQAYARKGLTPPHPLLEDTSVLHSPRRFGQYTANAIAATLPNR